MGENEQSSWKPFRDFINNAEQSLWLGGGQQLTQQHAYTVNLWHTVNGAGSTARL